MTDRDFAKVGLTIWICAATFVMAFVFIPAIVIAILVRKML